jgi:hypothetical protein
MTPKELETAKRISRQKNADRVLRMVSTALIAASAITIWGLPGFTLCLGIVMFWASWNDYDKET